MIMVSIWKHSARSAAINQSNAAGGNSFTLRNVLIAGGLALMLGLGWGFGLAASSHKISELACTFQFVFSFFVSCQGLFLLIFHGVRSNDAKETWRSWFGIHSRSHSFAVSKRLDDSGTANASGHAEISLSSNSTEDPSVSLDQTSCKVSAGPTTAEVIAAVASPVKNMLDHDLDNRGVKTEDTRVPQRKIPRSFMSLSILKKDAHAELPHFRSESHCTHILLDPENDFDEEEL